MSRSKVDGLRGLIRVDESDSRAAWELAATDATNRMLYSAHGGLSVMKLGNGLWEHTNFNSRLQPLEIGLGTTNSSSSSVGLTYNYGTTTIMGTC